MTDKRCGSCRLWGYEEAPNGTRECRAGLPKLPAWACIDVSPSYDGPWTCAYHGEGCYLWEPETGD